MSGEHCLPSLFANPPWRGGASRYRIGLTPVEADCWLPLIADAATRERKLALYRDCYADVVQALPGHDTAQELLVQALERGGERPVPRRWPHAIADAALLVPDDLCLMVDAGKGYRLVAASLCAPTYWRLADKLGADLRALHAGHAGLVDSLGARMTDVFMRLPMHRVLERRNWFLYSESALYSPQASPQPDTCPFEALFVRSERQTLRRLAPDCIVFTIRVSLEPLAAIRDWPESAKDMAVSLRRLTSIEQQAFSQRHRLPELLSWLDGVAG
ncbi:MAG: DUF3445 domain-containing protein [Pseudomonadales bacterium]